MIVAYKMLSRRATFILVAVGMFLGTMMLISSRLNDACPGGQFCPPDLGAIRDKFNVNHPHKDEAPKSTSAPSTSHVTSNPPKGGDSGFGPNPEKPVDQSGSDVKGSTDQPPKHHPKIDPECADFPDTSNVLVIMKTGASEAYSKVPTQVLTNARCLPEFLIFSDMDQHIAGYHVRDSLDNVTPAIMKHKDFDIYRHQKECAVDQDSCNKGYDVKKKGWELDKYKNVHIAEKTWKLRPNYDWYLYTDVDTYVVWPTMAKWLKTLNPKEPQYLGSAAYLANMGFGHGGSGYLLSNAAMKKMFDGKKNVAREYDVVAKGTCCGDYVLAKALKDKLGLDIQNMVSWQRRLPWKKFMNLTLTSGPRSTARSHIRCLMKNPVGANPLRRCTTFPQKSFPTLTLMCAAATLQNPCESRICTMSLSTTTSLPTATSGIT